MQWIAKAQLFASSPVLIVLFVQASLKQILTIDCGLRDGQILNLPNGLSGENPQ
jgi:hypothetical protein